MSEEVAYMEGPPGSGNLYQVDAGYPDAPGSWIRFNIPLDHRYMQELVQPWLDAGNTLLPWSGPFWMESTGPGVQL